MAAPACPRRSSPRLRAGRHPGRGHLPGVVPVRPPPPERRHQRQQRQLHPGYLCTAEAGYDGPTGWGTPNGVAAFVTGQEWTPWLGEVGRAGPVGDHPGVSARGRRRGPAHRLDAFVWGADNSIWHVWWNGMGWSGWESQGNPGVPIASSPAAVSWGPSHIDLFAVGADGNLSQKTYNNAWENWASPVPPPPPGIAPGSSPAVSSWTANRLDVFVRGTDNAIWRVSSNG